MSKENQVLVEEISIDRPVVSLSWHQTWMLALTRPSVGTFVRIAHDPNATTRRAYLWVFFGALGGEIVRTLMLVFLGGGQGPDSTTVFSICVPVSVVAAVLSFTFVTWVAQRIAGGLFHGKGAYETLVYSIAAFYAPLYIICSLIIGLPALYCLIILPLIYEIVLSALAVAAVHGIGLGKGAVTYIAGLVIVTGITVVFTVCALLVLGPSVSNVILRMISESGFSMP